MAATKKFRSTSGKEVWVVNQDQDVGYVGLDWTTLPSKWWAVAYAAGCESEDMVSNNAEDSLLASERKMVGRVFDKRSKIKTAILQLIEENNVSNFMLDKRTKSYKPKANVISSRIHEQINNTDRDIVWNKMLEDGIKLPEFN